jgi:cobaltochelatase CobN
MKEFFEKNSPYAYQDITARMEETIRKGYWKADEATEKKLLEEYLESVNEHGAGCAEHTCGNPRLLKHVMERAKALGIPSPVIDRFQQAMEKAIRQNISKAAKAVEGFVQKNEEAGSASKPRTISKATPPAAPAHEGFLMEVSENQRPNKAIPQIAAAGEWDALWVSLPVLGFLLAWRWRDGRHSRNQLIRLRH